MELPRKFVTYIIFVLLLVAIEVWPVVPIVVEFCVESVCAASCVRSASFCGGMCSHGGICQCIPCPT
ncbi:hypothetical protein ACP70R_019745 [Stipagrostis hirtigluma subsp. patula]